MARQPRIEPLGSFHNRAGFSSEVPALDRYLVQQADQDIARHVAAVFVLIEPPSPAVIGFYTLAATSVLLQALPPSVVKKLPRYPQVPATLLVRLAVDAGARGRGYGSLLLLDALARTLVASRTVASAAVVVDAKHESARKFYEHHHLLSLPDSPSRLFIPMRTVTMLFPPHRR